MINYKNKKYYDCILGYLLISLKQTQQFNNNIAYKYN